jgi:hypothetical protein
MKERFGLGVAPHERPPVAWYELSGLLRVAREQLWSLNLLRNLDRREAFTGPFEAIDLTHEGGPDEDFWFDFVADTGDGSSATTAVAQGLLAPRLKPQWRGQIDAEAARAHPEGLPTGRLLVLGGDLAYPGASPDHYQARLVEPFELARPTAAFDPRKIVVAIPQNHDWMDSLSTFCRYFVNHPRSGLLKARAPQRRSYFALALPHGWTMLGLDFALTGDIDRAQFEAFQGLLKDGVIRPGAPVVLLYPEPYWSREVGDRSEPGYPKRYQRLEALLMRHGCQIQLRLAGDLHHYVRESLCPDALGHPSALVTCGSGGAFGHPTHAREVWQAKYLLRGIDPDAAQDDLRERVFVGRSPGGTPRHNPDTDQLHRFTREVEWPGRDVSRRRAWGNLLALLRWRHRGFTGTIAVWMVLAATLPSCEWAVVVGSLPGALAAITVGTENDPGRSRWDEKLLVLPLLAGVVALMWGIAQLHPWWWRPLAACLGVGLLFGSYLALMSAWLGRVPNNAASALGREREKGFLRLRVHPAGIEVFMLGIDEAPRRWRPNPEGWPRWLPVGTPPVWRVIDRFDLRR